MNAPVILGERLTSGDTEITGREKWGDNRAVAMLTSTWDHIVQVSVESFHLKSCPGGIHLISNQDTKHRSGHIELKALVKLSREYWSCIDPPILTTDGRVGEGAVPGAELYWILFSRLPLAAHCLIFSQAVWTAWQGRRQMTSDNETDTLKKKWRREYMPNMNSHSWTEERACSSTYQLLTIPSWFSIIGSFTPIHA